MALAQDVIVGDIVEEIVCDAVKKTYKKASAVFQADAAEELRAYQILCLLTISVLFFSKNIDLPLLAKLNLFPAPVTESIHGQSLPKRVEGANENHIGLAQLPVMHAFQQHVRADQALVIPRA